MNNETIKISRLMLERFLCDECTLHERTVIESAYRNDPEVKAAIDKMRESTVEIFAAYPADEMAREIESRAHVRDVERRVAAPETSDAPRRRLFMLPIRAITAMLVAIVCVPWLIVQVNNRYSNAETVRVKGQQPYLTIYRKTGSGFERLHDRSAVSPGNRIQIGYVSAGQKYGCIFSVDGNGVVTLHHPTGDSSKPAATLLERGNEHLLAASFELDSAPRFERFFFVTSERPLNVAELLADCEEQLARNPAAPSVSFAGVSGMMRHTSITLIKETSR